MKVLRGNDVIINWTIRKLRNSIPVAEDFSNSTVDVYIVDSYGARKVEHTITGNVISIHIGGEIQRLGFLALDAYWEHNITKVNSRAKVNDVVEFVDNPEDVDLNGLPDDIDIATTATISDVYYGGEYIADFSKYYTKTEIDKLIIKDYNKLLNIPLELTKDGSSYDAKKLINLPYGGVYGNFVTGVSGAYIDSTGNGEFETINVRKGILINGEPWNPGSGGTIDQKEFDKYMQKWFMLDDNGDIRAGDKGVDEEGNPVPRGLYSNSFVTAGGVNTGGGGGGGGASTLGQLTNVGDWADAQPDEDRLFIQKAGATHWSSILLKNLTVDLSNYYTKAETSKLISDHANNTDIHVSKAEKDLWNKVAGFFAEDVENKGIYVTNNAAGEPRGLYSNSYITAGGVGTSGGGGGGGATTLGELVNVGEWADTIPEQDLFFVKRAGATHWSSMNIADIRVDLSNYYTKSETDNKISVAVNPLSKRLTDHINDEVVHITAAERALWNKLASWFAEDTVNKAIYVTHAADDSPRGFYTDGYVTAGGVGSGGGGGGSLDEDLLWSILGDGVNPDKQIAMSHLTVALATYITATQLENKLDSYVTKTSLATTLGSYSTTAQMNTAISDAVKDYIPLTQKGAPNGVVPLDGSGIIASRYLPSYVDDVLEYSSVSAFPSTGETGKIYIAIDSNLTYRWTGSQYTEISKSLALGETAETAYPGDRGKANRDNINRLKNAKFWGASYQSDGNVFGEFNGTIIRLTNNLFTPKIKIGDIYIEYDSTANGLKVVKYAANGDEEAAGLYTTGYLTAGGVGSGGGGGTGGGNIMLNDILYEPVDGIITLPVASNNLAFNEGIAYVKSDGVTEIGNKLDFHDPATTNQDYDYRLHQIYDNGAVLVGSGKFRATEIQKTGGTASQFLKADGSVDSNLYAKSYRNQDTVLLSDRLYIGDLRDTVMIPTTFADKAVTAFFNMQSTPTNTWWSGITVNGWDNNNYLVWQLAGPSSTTNYNEHLHFRVGKGSTWNVDWKPLAFLEDVKDVGEVYFDNQDIYVDYGYWVVGLCKLTPTTSEAGINGVMYYNRRNGIYANGSVQFSIQKKYNTSNAYVGVLYNGYGIEIDSDAPKPCTFTYGGVKYCGFKWASAASLNTIKTIIHETWGNNAPFYILYARSSGSNVINSEIKNSVVELGSDIDTRAICTTGRIYTSDDRIEINNIRNGWAYTRYRTNGRFFDAGLSGTTAGMDGAGNFEIRSDGSDKGIFVRYSGSSYGKLGVVSKDTQECSISYFNSTNTDTYPLWTVGVGIRNPYSFDWFYRNQGYKMTLDSEGKLFVNRRSGDAPSISLAIGDNDTGLNWNSDGHIKFYANNLSVGYWNINDANLHNCYFRNPTNNDYNGLALMVNGNGTANTVKPGIGFHQPGVYANSLRSDGAGDFRFCVQGGSVGCTVQAANFYANGGWLYSNSNGCEVRIGSQNTGYVHITNNANRIYYFDNKIDINGWVRPYTHNASTLGTSDRYWAGAYISRVYGQSDTAIYLITNYIGGQQNNPQTYFNDNVGLKVAMTASITYWNDTLWINGYAGGDVRNMCALHTMRNGTPEMYISTQLSNATAYGTMYRFYTSYNSNHSSADWVCKALNANGRVTCADVYSSSWLRTTGQTGWYSESYGGGWYMTDSTWVRTYNNKQIYSGSTSVNAIHTAGGMNAAGRIYGGGPVTAGGGLDVTGVMRTTGCSGFNVYGRFYGNSQHGAIEIGASDNVLGIGVHQNNSWYMWWTNAGSVDSSSGKSYIFEYSSSSFRFTGNVFASAAITAGTTSDIRLKKDFKIEDYSNKLLSLGNVFTYKYNDTAKRRKDKLVDDNYHIGLSYQVVKEMFPNMAGLDKDGYGYLNYISPDFISLIAGAVQESIKRLNGIDDKIDKLRKDVNDLLTENRFLKSEIRRLNKLVA